MGTASTGRPATLRTIAELAGIHASTVSRVLNTPGAASQAAAPETVARIRAIAADLGYRPNPHAASLRTRCSPIRGCGCRPRLGRP
jgi:LacI family transcriptional regulator